MKYHLDSQELIYGFGARVALASILGLLAIGAIALAVLGIQIKDVWIVVAMCACFLGARVCAKTARVRPIIGILGAILISMFGLVLMGQHLLGVAIGSLGTAGSILLGSFPASTNPQGDRISK